MRALLPIVFAVIPVLAQAQGVIAGVARDASAGVLPGVTIEVASPALIEKTRSAVSDQSGRSRVVALPDGRYTVSFTLAGFTTVVRTERRGPGEFHGDRQCRHGRRRLERDHHRER